MNVLLTGAFSWSEEQLNNIKNLGYGILFMQNEKSSPDFDCLSVDAAVCNGLFLYSDISLFKNLKFIQLTSAGLDRVPLEYIEQNEIKIANARGVYSIPIAEWVILKLLEIYKRSSTFIKRQENRIWEKERGLSELYDKTACIVGTGSIGIETAKRLKAFGVRTLGVDVFSQESEFIDERFFTKSLKEALKKSDIVILTLPLTEETRGLFSDDMLSCIKDGGVLVNVSRGAVLNESALCRQLCSGRLTGAALDVFESEPLDSKSPLWDTPGLIITPHNSFVSDRTNQRMFNIIYDNLQKLINRVL